MVREVWVKASRSPEIYRNENGSLRIGMPRVRRFHQFDLFQQASDGVASVEDVPRAIRKVAVEHRHG